MGCNLFQLKNFIKNLPMLTFPQYSKSNTYWATSIFIKYSEVIWKSKKFLFDRLFLLFWHFYGIKRSSYGRRLWPLIAYLWLHEKCLYAEFYRSGFSRIQTEYKDFVCKFAYSIQMWEAADPKNSQYRQFLRCVLWATFFRNLSDFTLMI